MQLLQPNEKLFSDDKVGLAHFLAKLLSGPHKTAFDKYVEMAKSWAHCTEPANREAAEAGVRAAYKAAGHRPPLGVFWADNPVKAIQMVANLEKNDNPYVNTGVEPKDFQRLIGPNTRFSWADSAALLGYYHLCHVELRLEDAVWSHGLVEIAKNAGWFFPLDLACVVIERPSFYHPSLIDPDLPTPPIGELMVQYRDGCGQFITHWSKS